MAASSLCSCPTPTLLRAPVNTYIKRQFIKQSKDTEGKHLQAYMPVLASISLTQGHTGHTSAKAVHHGCWQVITHRRLLWSMRVVPQNPRFVFTKAIYFLSTMVYWPVGSPSALT
jgi:hypothetical protein